MKNLFLLCCVLVLFSCKKDNLNCTEFKIGKFEQLIEEVDTKINIERTIDGFQTESSKYGISKYKLKWKSDCQFESELIETTIPFSKKNIGKKYNVEIIRIIDPKTYIYKCWVDGVDFVDSDTITKIN